MAASKKMALNPSPEVKRLVKSHLPPEILEVSPTMSGDYSDNHLYQKHYIACYAEWDDGPRKITGN